MGLRPLLNPGNYREEFEWKVRMRQSAGGPKQKGGNAGYCIIYVCIYCIMRLPSELVYSVTNGKVGGVLVSDC